MSGPAILGLETSCDETAAAVVEGGTKVRSNVVATQHELHREYRGVVPEIASRAHLQRLTPVVEAALSEAGVKPRDLDAIAVGHRPGLIGSLIVGLAAAKALAWSLGKPLIGVDHIHAHLHAPHLTPRPQAGFGRPGLTRIAAATPPIAPTTPRPPYPALGLVISGGHTSLYRLTSPIDIASLGQTIDDAVGEAYDKAAVTLGLGYPGGPILDKLAATGDAARFDLPRSMLGPTSLDFSFSGLKTALLYQVRGQPIGRGSEAHFERSADDLSKQDQADLAASFQAAAVEALMTKLKRALVQHPAPCVIVGGGVSANRELRRRLQTFAQDHAVAVHVPPMAYCTDNAAMIAGLACPLLVAGRTAAMDLPALATTALR